MDDIHENELNQKNYFFKLSALVPFALCVALSLFYEDKYSDSSLEAFALGWLLTCFVCPFYLMILCCYHTLKRKKSIPFNICATICLFTTALTNLALAMLIIVSSGVFALILIILSLTVSMALMAVCLLGVYALNKLMKLWREKKLRNTEREIIKTVDET